MEPSLLGHGHLCELYFASAEELILHRLASGLDVSGRAPYRQRPEDVSRRQL